MLFWGDGDRRNKREIRVADGGCRLDGVGAGGEPLDYRDFDGAAQGVRSWTFPLKAKNGGAVDEDSAEAYPGAVVRVKRDDA